MAAATTTHRVVGGRYPAEQHPDGTWTIRGVRVFTEIPRGENGNQIPVDAAWHQKALDLHAQMAAEQFLPPLHIYHHDPNNPFVPKPERAGLFHLTGREARVVRGKVQSVLVANFERVPASVFKRIDAGEFPYVSVETPKGYTSTEILSCALLDSEPPYCPLPILSIGEKTRALHGRRTGAVDGVFNTRVKLMERHGMNPGNGQEGLLRSGLKRAPHKEDDVSEQHGATPAPHPGAGKNRPADDNTGPFGGRGTPAKMPGSTVTMKGQPAMPSPFDPASDRKRHADDTEPEQHADANRPWPPAALGQKKSPIPVGSGKPPSGLVKTGARHADDEPREENMSDTETGKVELEQHAAEDHSNPSRYPAGAPQMKLSSEKPGGMKLGAGTKANADAAALAEYRKGRHADDDAMPAGDDQSQLAEPAADAAPNDAASIAAALAADQNFAKSIAGELFALMNAKPTAPEAEELNGGPVPLEPEDMSMTHANKRLTEQHAANTRELATLRAKVAAMESAKIAEDARQAHARMIRDAEDALAGFDITPVIRENIRKIATHGREPLAAFVETLVATMPTDPPATYGDFMTPRAIPATDPELAEFASKGPEVLTHAREHLGRFRELQRHGRLANQVTFKTYLAAQNADEPLWSADDQREYDQANRRKA